MNTAKNNENELIREYITKKDNRLMQELNIRFAIKLTILILVLIGLIFTYIEITQ